MFLLILHAALCTRASYRNMEYPSDANGGPINAPDAPQVQINAPDAPQVPVYNTDADAPQDELVGIRGVLRNISRRLCVPRRNPNARGPIRLVEATPHNYVECKAAANVDIYDTSFLVGPEAAAAVVHTSKFLTATVRILYMMVQHGRAKYLEHRAGGETFDYKQWILDNKFYCLRVGAINVGGFIGTVIFIKQIENNIDQILSLNPFLYWAAVMSVAIVQTVTGGLFPLIGLAFTPIWDDLAQKNQLLTMFLTMFVPILPGMAVVYLNRKFPEQSKSCFKVCHDNFPLVMYVFQAVIQPMPTDRPIKGKELITAQVNAHAAPASGGVGALFPPVDNYCATVYIPVGKLEEYVFILTAITLHMKKHTTPVDAAAPAMIIQLASTSVRCLDSFYHGSNKEKVTRTLILLSTAFTAALLKGFCHVNAGMHPMMTPAIVVSACTPIILDTLSLIYLETNEENHQVEAEEGSASLLEN